MSHKIDISTYNEKPHQERRFPRDILRIKFWFRSRSSRNADGIACENDNATKSRTEKLLRSFKRSFRPSRTRSRDLQSQTYSPTEQPMAVNIHLPEALNQNYEASPPVPPRRDLEEDGESRAELPNCDGSPPVPPRRRQSVGEDEDDAKPVKGGLAQEHLNLAKYGWYWGPLTKREAVEHLSCEPDGAFLVRDSSSQNHIYTLSFRSYGYTMHAHIEYAVGTYKLGSLVCLSVPKLIEDALTLSENSIFSYSNHDPPTPIRLLKPVSRNMQMRSLMHLCRFVVRQHCNVNAIEELPLPATLKKYLLQGQY